MNVQVRELLRGAVTISVVVVAAISLYFAGIAISNNAKFAEMQRESLCRNQHAVVEMQRLFLQAHQNLREQLEAVGVPNEPDHDLLVRLADLIESAECRVESQP